MSAALLAERPLTSTSVRSARTADELVRAHMPLVSHLVRELLGRLPSHVNRDDLMSAGCFALTTSAQSFDDSRGVPFARFAAIRIRGALTDELRAMDWASRAVRGRAREAETVRDELAARLGRTPGREEVASAMHVDVAHLDAVDADVHRASLLSLQGLTEAAGDGILPDGGAGPEGLLLRREQLGLLRDAIAELPERLRTVIEAYFFAQRKMADIAEDLGVTESRVSQLRSEALTMLRAGLRAQDGDASAAAEGTAGDARAARAARDARDAQPARAAQPAHAAQVARTAAAPSRRRGNAFAAYAMAIASRSTLADRLAATTVLGDMRASAAGIAAR